MALYFAMRTDVPAEELGRFAPALDAHDLDVRERRAEEPLGLLPEPMRHASGDGGA